MYTVFPDPGGPIMRRLWCPAAVTVSARTEGTCASLQLGKLPPRADLGWASTCSPGSVGEVHVVLAGHAEDLVEVHDGRLDRPFGAAHGGQLVGQEPHRVGQEPRGKGS